MKKIEKMQMVEESNAKDYHNSLNKIIEERQVLNLEVEVSHSMCRAVKGIGYMYSAVVIGKQG